MGASIHKPAARLNGGDEGATAVEYALMIGGVALLIVVAVVAFGASVNGLFEDIAEEAARWLGS